MGAQQSLQPPVEHMLEGPRAFQWKKEPIILYEWNGSPPCHKVRALLHYKEHPYRAVEVDLNMTELKWQGNQYFKVPQAIIGRNHVCDSHIILKELTHMVFERPMTNFELDLENTCITNGLQPAWEKLILSSLADTTLFFSLMLDYSSTFGWILGGVAPRMMIASMNKHLDKAYPALEAPIVYLQRLRTSMGSKNFICGDAVGPVDLALYGVLESAHYLNMECWPGPVKEADLLDWHDRMAAEMKGKQPVCQTAAEVAASKGEKTCT